MAAGSARAPWPAGRRTLLTALALQVAATAGCGFAERTAVAERLTDAPARGEGGAVAGTITVESRFIDGPPGALTVSPGVPGMGGPAGPAGAPPVTAGGSGAWQPGEPLTLATSRARFLLDLGRSESALLHDGSDRPFVVVDDLVFYGRRTGIPDDDARPWVRFDLADVAEGGGRANPLEVGADSLAAAHPAIVTDLAAGLLAGSIERVGTADVGGVRTTAYRGNVGIDKALTRTRRARYSEERLEQVRTLLDTLGVSGDVHPARVWLDDDGRLRRFEVELVQRPLPKVEFGLRITVDYEAYGVAFEPPIPQARELLTVDTVVRFIRTVAVRPASATGDAVAGAEPATPEGGP